MNTAGSLVRSADESSRGSDRFEHCCGVSPGSSGADAYGVRASIGYTANSKCVRHTPVLRVVEAKNA